MVALREAGGAPWLYLTGSGRASPFHLWGDGSPGLLLSGWFALHASRVGLPSMSMPRGGVWPSLPLPTKITSQNLKEPKMVELEAGKDYFWCACGRSKNQPFCDGSHQETSLTPVKFTAEETKTAPLCQCKQTGNTPFCDGSHMTLE